MITFILMMLYQQRKPKIDDWEDSEEATELHSTKECAHVRFATWPKIFGFLVLVATFPYVSKKQSTFSVVYDAKCLDLERKSGWTWMDFAKLDWNLLAKTMAWWDRSSPYFSRFMNLVWSGRRPGTDLKADVGRSYQLLVFSVTQFKIDRNKKSKPFNRLSPGSGNRKKVDMQRLSPGFRSQ